MAIDTAGIPPVYILVKISHENIGASSPMVANKSGAHKMVRADNPYCESLYLNALKDSVIVFRDSVINNYTKNGGYRVEYDSVDRVSIYDNVLNKGYIYNTKQKGLVHSLLILEHHYTK